MSLKPEEVLAHVKPEVRNNINPWIYDMFTEPQFVNHLPERLRNPAILALYLENCSQFADHIHDPEIFGELVELPETQHATGRTRRAEQGNRILLDQLRMKGINPAYVLYFRASQPSEKPKPEYYWTSDFWETRRGLTQEIPMEQRKTAVTLVSTLEDIAGDGGVMNDINDDQGLAVRRVNLGDYDQKRTLFSIPFESSK